MNVAVVGCGYWGNHVIRNFNSSKDWNLLYICDTDLEHLEKMSRKYANAIATDNYNKIILDDRVDAIAIATPVFTHFELAKKSLIAGKHTWVEKPLTSTVKEAEELIELAEKNNVLLHVDHTFIYTSAVGKIKEIIDSGELGDILYFDSVRVNLGLFQHDVNVIWDLAPHDFSILEYAVGKKPVSINATGQDFFNHTGKKTENIAYVTVGFDDGSIAHFNVNWMSPVKIRHIIFGGNKKMLVYDDMETISKIKIYDSGISIKNREEIYNALIQYRTGDMFSPAISNTEALEVECEHFYHSIKNNTKTNTDGHSGLYVVKLLEAANESLRNEGRPIKL
jgi:predicted dehydrogenase